MMMKKIQETIEKQNRILDSLPEAIMIFDNEEKHTYVNKSVSNFVNNRTPKDFIGKTHRELGFPEELCRYWEKHIHKTFETEKTQTVEFKVGEKYVSWILQPIMIEKNCEYVLTSARDITNLKEKEALIQKINQRLSLHREQTSLGVIEWNLDFRVSYWNPGAESIFGFSAQEAHGQHAHFIIAEKNKEELDNVWKKIITQKREIKSENENKTKNGDIIFCEWNNTPLTDENGEIIGVVSIVYDSTPKKAIEENMRKMSKINGFQEIAGSVAHNLNNILGGITMTLSVIKQRPDMFESKFQQINDALYKAASLVQKMKQSWENKDIQIQNIDVEKIIKNALDITLSSSIIKLQYTCEKNRWFIKGDENALSEVFINLIINATQAMPKGGDLNINIQNYTVKSEIYNIDYGEYVEIIISDTGIGIPEEKIKYIFDPFFTTKQKGQGLGLSSAYKIIQQHKGFIGVESKQGQGTIFKILIPASKNKSEKKEKRKALSGNKKHILIVDDDDLIRENIVLLLEMLKYRPHQAKSGEEAIEIFQNCEEKNISIDVFILDMTIQTGKLQGDDTLRELCKINPNVQEKAILFSGHKTENIQEMGFRYHLEKPGSIDAIQEIVEKVIEQNKIS